MAKELVKQRVERNKLEDDHIHKNQKKVLADKVNEMECDRVENTIFRVLQQHHIQQKVQLEEQFRTEIKAAQDEARAHVAEMRQNEKDLLIAEQEKVEFLLRPCLMAHLGTLYTGSTPENEKPTASFNTTDISESNYNDIIKNLNSLKGFRIGHINITSLTKYIDQLRIYLSNESLDILSINETRLDGNIRDSDLLIKGYDIIRKDRNREGGGVAIYYRSHLNIRNRDDLIPVPVESVCIEVIKAKSRPLLITSLYRPPNGNAELLDQIQSLVENIDNENKELILVGDINCDLLPEVKSYHANRFLDIINLFQLDQLITEPSRITDNSATLLDLFLTNSAENIRNSGVLHLGISDHSLIYGCRKIGSHKSSPKLVQSRNFKNYNTFQFKNDLASALALRDWGSSDPNVLWNEFKDTFIKIADLHAPIRQRRVRSNYAPWLNEQIKTAMNNRDYLKKKSVKTNSTYFHLAFKKARNCVNKLVKKTKADYYKETIDMNKNNPKEMWKHINQLIGKKSKTTNIPCIKESDKILSSDKDIAEAFNSYFSNIGTELSNRIPQTNTNIDEFIDPVSASFKFKYISIDEITNIIRKLNSSKTSGLDKIPAKILKDSSDVTVFYLTNIFNCSLSSGIFPKDWKKAKVSPIYKSGDKEECENYRPISILSVVAKVFEKLVVGQLESYLVENKILSKYQSGFRGGHSTASSLLSATNSWLINMDAGLINGVMFLDLKKAFDTVDHQIMIRKLYLHGIKDSALTWFISYLSDRTQVCKINNTTSSLKPVRCGVPQGSNLGPLLFLLYINDLPNCLKISKPAMYADDTNFTICGKSAIDLEKSLNQELENVHRWLLANRLTLNIKKTEYMIIGSRQRLSKIACDMEMKVSIASEEIKGVTSTKCLGIIIDQNLSWKQQIDSISTKVSRAIGTLRRSKPYINKDSLRLLYQTIVLPFFDYCSLVWGNCNQTLREKIQKLQNRAARTITGDTYDVRSKDILTKLGWKNLDERRMVQLTSYVSKALKNECPENINDMFKVSNNENYNLRNNNLMLMLSKPKTNAMKRAFSYAGAKVWNNQSTDIKSAVLNFI